ncbi:MAG: tetraacyldisaccharide 4'-kinase [Hyphomicrobiales bacterium]|nr:tetraacyldisaccharide 4'-kinase [Hyphomicrobiales bacterium]
MLAPSFWDAPGRSWQASALAPLGFIYDALTRLRFWLARPYQSRLPVICVGNLTAGGAGKTPAVLALAELLRGQGLSPAILSRGYGGAESGPVVVDPKTQTAEAVGDEPLLLARAAPAIVSRNRPAGARLAEQIGADLIVMDDGLQNPSLAKTASFAVIDAETGIGNGRVIPAGPLRAGLDFQIKLIDALILVGKGPAGETLAARAKRHGIPVFRARIAARNDGEFAGKRVIAFAGIARPKKFFALLTAAGADIVAERGFSDHHAFSDREAEELLAVAEREGALPVSTEKDLARLKGRTGTLGRLADETRPLRVSLIFDDASAVAEFLLKKGIAAKKA